jgi:catechol 2,3-dioxygenase-like lactoylglutathione lyase family enzyme
LLRNLATKMAGDPQTFALAALFSFQGANTEIKTTRERVHRPRWARGRSGHDGYHIATYMACQGKPSLGFRPRTRPLLETITTRPVDWFQLTHQAGADPSQAGLPGLRQKEQPMLFDHVDLRVSDLGRVRGLYDTLLPAMGFSRIAEDADSVCYYCPGEDRSAPFFGLALDPNHRPNGTRIAIRAADRAGVDCLAGLAQRAGAAAFEAAHVCAEYKPFYYATFFEDADGNKLEICYRAAPT